MALENLTLIWSVIRSLLPVSKRLQISIHSRHDSLHKSCLLHRVKRLSAPVSFAFFLLG